MFKEDPQVPTRIAKHYNLTVEGISLVTNYSDNKQHQFALEKWLKSQGVTDKIMWYKPKEEDDDAKARPVVAFWTNDNFDVFGFCKTIAEDGEITPHVFMLPKRIVTHVKPLF